MIIRTVFIYIILSSFLFAQEFEIYHDRSRLVLNDSDQGHTVDYAGIVNLSSINPQIGYPDLPVYVYKVLLPEGQRVESFDIVSIDKSPIKGKFNIVPRQEPWRQDIDEEAVTGNDNPDVLQALYPQDIIRYLGTGNFGGQAIAHFEVFPVQYHALEKSLTFIDKISFSINTTIALEKPVQPESTVQSINMTAQLLSISEPTTVNASMIDGEPYNPVSPFADMENGLIDRYVVITTDELRESFEPLVSWKTEKGVPAIVRTMSWIREHFPAGVDDSERLRNYIRWTYRYRGTRYVLLGGETELVPTRIITTGGYTFPTDYYYSDLDGSWNANQNQIFGEAADKTDAYPEVWVSRIPVETPGDVDCYTQKLFKYEKLQNITNPDFPANILYMAANLNKDDDGKELIMRHIDPQINPAFKRTLLTQSEHIGASHDIPYAELSKNYALIFTENHGAYFVIHPGKPGPSSIFAYEAGSLTNPDPSIWYMASCSTNDIVKRAFSEVYMRSEHGGVAYIGNSDFEYPFSGIYLQKEFYSLVFNKGYYHLAEAHFLSRLPYLGYMSWEGPSRIIVLSTIVLGDPEMPVWTEKPQGFNVEISGLDILTFHITGQIDSTAVEGATVVLYKEGAVYKISQTDVSGKAYFTRSEISSNNVTCTITAHNYIPHQQDLGLPHVSGPDLHLAEYVFRLLRGSDNNLFEPGEQYDLDLTLENSGSSVIDGMLTIKANSSDSLLLFAVDSLGVELSIAPNEQIDMGSLNFSVSGQLHNDTSLVIPLTLFFEESHLKTEYLTINIGCPQVRIAEMNWSTVAAEDSFAYTYSSSLDILVQNSGNGAADSLYAVFFADSTFSIDDTSGCYIGQVNSHSDKWMVNACTLNHNKPLNELELLVSLIDPRGLQNVQRLNFLHPDPVSSVSFLPFNSTSIQINWTPSMASDITGYHIFRRKSGQQEFQSVNISPVQHGGFYIDDSLKLHQSYDYMIQAEDSSGNLSLFSSDTITAWSTLPYWQGFPGRLSEQAMGSNLNGVQVADLDGNGSNEIITSGGQGVLKVMNDQAEPLFELSGLNGMLTLPAIGNVYGSSVKEIIVSSYTEGRAINFLYIINGGNGEIIHTFDLGYNAPTSPVLKDIDGDGMDDLILLTHAGNAPSPPKNSRLFVWRSTGSGWEYFPDWTEEGYLLADNYCLGIPAAADLDRSGDVTVVVSTIGGKLHGFKPALSGNPIWTTSLPGKLNAPMCIADMDGNDTLDIIVPAMQEQKLYLVNHSGQPLSGWEAGVSVDVTDFWGFSAPAAIGNLDDDDALEIAYAGLQNVYVIDHDATIKDGWPIPIENSDLDKNFCNFTSPVLADMNHDGQSEIIFITTYGWLHAIDPKTKKNIPGFPIDTRLDIIDGHSPMIEDIERDGDLDVMFLGHDGILHIWDTQSPYLDGTNIHWNQAHANPAHTGELDTTILQIFSMISDRNLFSIPNRFFVKANYPNPFNPVTTIEFGLGQTADVRVDIFNILGQKVITLMNHIRPAGNYSVQWNGRNSHGILLSSGIYFYKVDIKHPGNGQSLIYHTGKMILIK